MIMRCLFKKRFSMVETIGLLAFVIIGLAIFAYATTNVPYTFKAGTTAKADEVNANFSALATAIDSISAWEKLGEIVLSADTLSVDFTNIPSGYRFLRVIGNAQLGSYGRVALRFNDDTANYFSRVIYAVPGAVSEYTWTDRSVLELEASGLETDIGDQHFFQALIGNEAGFPKLIQASSTVEIGLGWVLAPQTAAGRWNNTTDEISKITVIDGANSVILANSRFVLYGSK
jgi:hypothetical protein